MTSLRLSKDVSKRSKIETKGKKRKRKDYTSKWQGCVWSLLIYRGQEQDRWGWELVEKGTGSRRFWPPCPPPPPPPLPPQTCFNTKTTNCANASLHKKTQHTRVYMSGKYDWCFFLVGRQFMLHFLGCASTIMYCICIFAVLNFSYLKKLDVQCCKHIPCATNW